MSSLALCARRAARQAWVTALLLLAVTAALVYGWPERGLWYDETVNAYFAGQSWGEIWEWCTAIDNQMPLHFALLKLWGGVAGTSEFALRAFSVFSALLAAAGVIGLGRRLGGPAIGWLAGLIFALTQSFAYAAYEVRPYGLALALFAWSSVVLWTLWGRQARPFDGRYTALLAAYVMLALALLYTHYTGFVALAAHGAYVAGDALRHRTARRITILAHVGAGLAAGYLPWAVALAGRDVRAGTAYTGRVTPRAALETYAEFYAYGQQVVPPDAPRYALAAAALVAGAAIVGALWYGRHHARSNGYVFALLMALVPLAGLTIMVYAVQAKLSGRHGWPAWVGAVLLIGLGLAALPRRRWRWPVWAAALLIVWLPARANLQPYYNSYLREAFGYLREHARPGDVLVLRDGTLFTAAGYYGSPVPWAGVPPDRLTDVNRFVFFDEAIASLEALIDTHAAQRVWVVAWQGDIMDPQNLVGGILEAIGTPQPLEGAFGFGDVSVALYDLHDRPRALAERVAGLTPLVQLPGGGPLYLGGYVLTHGPVPRGGMVLFHTWWKRGEAVQPDLRVSARLYGADGAFYVQHDQPPVAASFGQELWAPDSPVLSRFALAVPSDMPPGPASVGLVLYDMQGAFEPIVVPVGEVEIAR